MDHLLIFPSIETLEGRKFLSISLNLALFYLNIKSNGGEKKGQPIISLITLNLHSTQIKKELKKLKLNYFQNSLIHKPKKKNLLFPSLW